MGGLILALALLPVCYGEFGFKMEQTPLMLSDRTVVLADAHLFPWTVEECEQMCKSIKLHEETVGPEIEMWNAPFAALQWHAAIGRMWDDWHTLANAKRDSGYYYHDISIEPAGSGFPYDIAIRLKHLNDLRDSIGEDNFRAGRMPTDVPRLNIQWKK